MIDKLKKYTVRDWIVGSIFIILSLVLWKTSTIIIVATFALLIMLIGMAFSMHLACITMIIADNFWNMLVYKTRLTLDEDMKEKCIWNKINKYIDNKLK
jgi:hypothetical protein